MSKKQVFMVSVGVVLLYAGVLSLTDEWYVGVGMMVGGSMLIVLPLWKAFVPARNLLGGSTGHSVKTAKRKKKRHLKVVKREDEERPTYH